MEIGPINEYSVKMEWSETDISERESKWLN